MSKFYIIMQALLALIPSLFFCFYHLPFKQAIRLPVIVYKPSMSFLFSKGKFIIDTKSVRFAMIRLGIFITPQYPNRGINGFNNGTIIFKGRMACGANSTIISSNKKSYIEFGDSFINTTTLRLNCHYRIVFGKNARIGWDVTIMDSSMHRLKNRDGNYLGRGFDEVIIGNDNWISTNCLVLSGAKTPDKCIFAARSVLNRDYRSFPPYSFFAGVPTVLKKTGVWRDVTDDVVDYNS